MNKIPFALSAVMIMPVPVFAMGIGDPLYNQLPSGFTYDGERQSYYYQDQASGASVPVDFAQGAKAPPVKGAVETFNASARKGETYSAKRTICDPWTEVRITYSCLVESKDAKGNTIITYVPNTVLYEMHESKAKVFPTPPPPPKCTFVSRTDTNVRDDRELTIRETKMTTGERSGLIGGVFNGVTDGVQNSFLWARQKDAEYTWPSSYYKHGALNEILYPSYWSSMNGSLPSSFPGGTLPTDAGGSCSSICGYAPNMSSCHTNIAGDKVCGISTGGKGSWYIMATMGDIPRGAQIKYPVQKFEVVNGIKEEARAHQFKGLYGETISSSSIESYRNNGIGQNHKPTESDSRKLAIAEEKKLDEAAALKPKQWGIYDDANAKVYNSIVNLSKNPTGTDAETIKRLNELTQRQDTMSVDMDYDAEIKSIKDMPSKYMSEADKEIAIKAIEAARKQNAAPKSSSGQSLADSKMGIQGSSQTRNIDLNKLRADKYAPSSFHMGASALTENMRGEAEQGLNSLVVLYPIMCK